MASAERLLASAIRDDAAALEALQGQDPADIWRVADEHGVRALLEDRVMRRPNRSSAWVALPTAIAKRAAADVKREHELRRCLEALDRAGCRPLVMKGAHLAYTCYVRPDLRPRDDTDLLIAEEDRPAAERTLAELGYQTFGHVTGALLTYQTAWALHRDGALVHVLDLHWRIANPQAFGAILTYDELSADAVPLPRLSPGARGLSTVHALVLACLHRVAHHGDADRLIWIYDIHLLAAAMDDEGWRRVSALARDRGLGAICERGLALAADRCGTLVPDAIRRELAASGDSPDERRRSAYLAPQRRHLDIVLDDLRALGWRDRWRLIREHAFPAATYMRDVYAPASTAPLLVLYAQRAVRGARRWLARS